MITKRKLRIGGISDAYPPEYHAEPWFTPGGAFSRLMGQGTTASNVNPKDKSVQYPHDIKVIDNDVGWYQRRKDYARMARMWRDQQASLWRMYQDDPNAILPEGFAGKTAEKDRKVVDYLHRTGRAEGMKGWEYNANKKPQQYVIHTQGTPTEQGQSFLLGSIGHKGPFLNRVGNTLNTLISFFPGLRDPTFARQIKTLEQKNKLALAAMDYHAKVKLRNPKHQMSQQDQALTRDFLSTFFVIEGMDPAKAKRAANITTGLYNKNPQAVEEIEGKLTNEGHDNVEDHFNALQEEAKKKGLTSTSDFEYDSFGDEEGDGKSNLDITYDLPRVTSTASKKYKAETCDFGKFLGLGEGEHLQRVQTSDNQLKPLSVAQIHGLRRALIAAKKEQHGSASKHLEGKLPANPDKTAFEFINDNAGWNASLNNEASHVRNAVKGAMEVLEANNDVNRINPMVGYVLGNPDHVQNIASQEQINRYDPSQPHTYFAPKETEQAKTNPLPVDVNDNSEVRLSDSKPIDLAWSILKGA